MHQALASVPLESATQRLAVDGNMPACQHRTPFAQYGGELVFDGSSLAMVVYMSEAFAEQSE